MCSKPGIFIEVKTGRDGTRVKFKGEVGKFRKVVSLAVLYYSFDSFIFANSFLFKNSGHTIKNF